MDTNANIRTLQELAGLTGDRLKSLESVVLLHNAAIEEMNTEIAGAFSGPMQSVLSSWRDTLAQMIRCLETTATGGAA